MKRTIIYFCLIGTIRMNGQNKNIFNQVKYEKQVTVWSNGQKNINTSYNDSITQVQPNEIKKVEKVKLNTSLPTNKFIMTSDYGYRIHPILGKRKFHSGIDIKTNKSNIYAILDGIVIKSGYDQKLGNYIKIKHRKIVSIYGHLSMIKVKKGQKIKGGQIIGISGSSGRATGDHLHFAIKLNKQFIDPKYLIQKIQRLNQ